MKPMNRSIPVRILTALSGLLLLGLAATVAAEGFFGVPVTAQLTAFLAAGGALAVMCRIVAALALMALAGCCVACALPARQPKQTGSIMQKGANGPFGITVGAIEKMVLACAAKHPEITRTEVDVREVRDGVVLLLNVQQVGGVSIPLSISRLQKQVREYVSARTGLDVAEVRVMVDNADDVHVASEFEVEDSVVPSAPVRTEEFVPAAPAVTVPPVAEKLAQIAEITSQPLPPEIAESEHAAEALPELPRETVDLDKLLPVTEAAPEMIDEDERPLHQRVFGAEEMPQMVPMPPEMTLPQPAPAAEAPALPAQDADAPEAPETLPAAAAEPEEDWTDPALQAAAEEVLSGEASPEEAPEKAEAEAEEPQALM